jgi:hypothetical protein
MLMRILALLVAVWVLVAMPALCRGGVLVACCAPTHDAEETSQGCPDGCPNSCPDESADECPDDTRSSDERDCSSCADICHSVSLTPGKPGSKAVEITFVPAVPATEALAGGLLSVRYAWPDAFDRRPRENLPFPASDRPLLL